MKKLSFSILSKKTITISLIAIVSIIGIGILQNTFGRNRFLSDKYEQNYAGEKVPFDALHQFNIERFDREVSINRMNESQMMMIWKRLPLFKPMIEKKLKEKGLPQDLFYLTLAESALRETAVSSAGAAGIWQFMPATAKGYGLRVDEYIDERYDTEKATDAAIQYLQKAYDKF